MGGGEGGATRDRGRGRFLHHTIAGRGVIWGILLGMVTFHVARSQVSPALGLGLLCGAQVATTRLCLSADNKVQLRISADTKILRNELLYMYLCNCL